MTEKIENDTSRRALARRNGLTDLGRLPQRIRSMADFWGGSAMGSRAIHELAQTDGLTQSIEDLRSEIARVHDSRGRNELLVWLESRVH